MGEAMLISGIGMVLLVAEAMRRELKRRKRQKPARQKTGYWR
jgi:hypothetical protein